MAQFSIFLRASSGRPKGPERNAWPSLYWSMGQEPLEAPRRVLHTDSPGAVALAVALEVGESGAAPAGEVFLVLPWALELGIAGSAAGSTHRHSEDNVGHRRFRIGEDSESKEIRTRNGSAAGRRFVWRSRKRFTGRGSQRVLKLGEMRDADRRIKPQAYFLGVRRGRFGGGARSSPISGTRHQEISRRT